MNPPDHTGSSGVDPAEAQTDMAATILTSGAGAREDIGGRIGPYKLLQVLGEGGCGTVFMAEQESPVRRRVALKLIKLGMDTKAVIARFELERQALALMDHPHIARVLDAGATETGRPYFVMELVKGVRLTEYCDQNQLSVQDRLGLFNQVCHAIQHAHQKGIVHRDIKPSNILVALHDNQPVPKVIDFGIAKATDQSLTSHTLITTLDQFVGTPAYMSPEQAELSGLDIDTRSDIYSLGVLLYELLTGQTPFDPRAAIKAGLSEVRRQIREEDAIPPSTKLRSFVAADLTTTARRRELDPPRLIHLLKGDLDCIVMKCLEKDRTRRYDTANALAADVQHFLANEPVQARPASQMYRFQKLVRRNRVAFAAVAGVAASLILALAISAWQVVEKSKAYTRAVNAEQEQSRLREAAETARQTEAGLRAEAQTSRAREVDLRRHAQARAYAADMNVAQRSLELNNFGRAQSLLDRHRPKAGEEDPRGWEWRFLWQQYRSDAEFELGRTNDWVNALAVSADGELVAMGERESGMLKVWNTRTRQPVTTIPCGDYILKAAFAPADSSIAVGAMVKTSGRNANIVRIISLGEAKPKVEIPLEGFCAGLQFSPDGQALTVSAGKAISEWQVADGTLIKRQALPGANSANTQGAVFSKDLSLVAMDAGQGELAIFERATGRKLWTMPPADKYFTSAAFSPDNRCLVTAEGYAESRARVWDARTGSAVKVLEGHGAYVLDLAFSPDGQTLATASADQTVRLWSTADWQLEATLRGHRLEVWRVAWLPDNQRLVSGAKDGSVLVWNRRNLRREKRFLALPGGIIDWAFTPDSRSILALNQDGKVTQWGGPDFSRGEPAFEVGTNVTSARFSPDSLMLAVCVTNRWIQFWNVPRRVMVHEFPGLRQPGSLYKFSSERQLAVVERGEWWMRFFDVPSGREAGSFPLSDQDGVVAARPQSDQMLRIPYRGPSQLRGITNAQITEINLAVRQPGDGAFSPDGKFLAVANKFGYARVWETGSWRETGTFGNFLKGVHSVAWSPDSRRLAVTSGDKEAVKLWDVLNGEELITLEGQGGMLSASKFSPDGNVITALDEKGALNIWRAPSWEQIRGEEQ